MKVWVSSFTLLQLLTFGDLLKMGNTHNMTHFLSNVTQITSDAQRLLLHQFAT